MIPTDEEKKDEELGYTVSETDLNNEIDSEPDEVDPYNFVESDLEQIPTLKNDVTMPKRSDYNNNVNALSMYMPKPDAPEDEEKKLRRAYAKQDVGNFAQGISALASLWGASKGAYPSAVSPVEGNTPILKYIQDQKTDRQAIAKETAQAMKADQAEYTADLRDTRKRYDALQAHNAKAEMQKAVEKNKAKEKAKDRKAQKDKHEADLAYRRQKDEQDKKTRLQVAGIRASGSKSGSTHASDKLSHYKKLYEQCISADPDTGSGDNVKLGALKEYMRAHGIKSGSQVNYEAFVNWCEINKRGIYKKK